MAREYCEEDIEELCKKERDAIELREGFAADAQVITCLEVGASGCSPQQQHAPGRQGWLGLGLGYPVVPLCMQRRCPGSSAYLNS